LFSTFFPILFFHRNHRLGNGLCSFNCLLLQFKFQSFNFFEDSVNLKANAMSPLNLHILFPTTLQETLGKFVTCVWGDSIVILPRVPIMDVLIEVPNVRIVDGKDCGGALLAWLGPVSSFGKYYLMVGAWEDSTWT